MSEEIRITETTRARVDGQWVTAANIWEREAPRPDGSTRQGMTAMIIVGESPGLHLQHGDELEVGTGRWRLTEIVEDPVERRGHVVLQRAG